MRPIRRCLMSRRRPSSARSVLAITRRPDVPLSRRWTIPQRSVVADPLDLRPPIDEAPGQCAGLIARPRMSDDPGRLVDDGQVIVLPGAPRTQPPRPASGAAGATGRIPSSVPALTRSAGASVVVPSTVTPPDSINCRAWARLTSAMMATTRSRRSPSSSLGTRLMRPASARTPPGPPGWPRWSGWRRRR